MNESVISGSLSKRYWPAYLLRVAESTLTWAAWAEVGSCVNGRTRAKAVRTVRREQRCRTGRSLKCGDTAENLRTAKENIAEDCMKGQRSYWGRDDFVIVIATNWSRTG